MLRAQGNDLAGESTLTFGPSTPMVMEEGLGHETLRVEVGVRLQLLGLRLNIARFQEYDRQFIPSTQASAETAIAEEGSWQVENSERDVSMKTYSFC